MGVIIEYMKIIIIKNKNISNYNSWPVWECEPSKFNWEYEQEEHCFIIEGRATITGGGSTVKISKGDYVIFPKGLSCSWKIDSTIKKYYTFK